MTSDEEYDATARRERVPEFERSLRTAPQFRMLPASDIAERGVICSILLEPVDCLGLCDERGVLPAWFHNPALGTIFGILGRMHDERKKIDLVTLTQRLADERLLDQVGGAATIAELFTYLPTATNVRHYIDTLQEKHVLRNMITVCTEFTSRGYEEQDNIGALPASEGQSEKRVSLLDEIEKRVMQLRPVGRNVRCYSGKDIARMAMDSVSRRLERSDEIAGLSTGFADLDLKTDGMHDTELIVLAARPGLGKSSCSGQIAEYLAVDRQVPVGIFSLEMGAELYAERCVVSRARVNTARWRGGQKPSASEIQRIQTSAEAFHVAPYHVEELSDATVQHLRTAARKMVQQHGVRFIVIDSLSKLRSNSKQGRENREREVSEAIGGCKEIAKELKLPVMVIVHLHRRVDDLKEGEKPSLRDLRESGAIEQDADSVWMLYRHKEDGTTRLVLPKQRAGAADEECAFWFEAQHTRFRPVQTADEEADAEARRQKELNL